ncbi:hypothetical protein [Microbulbifer sp. SAOS-129_SWC]|uniref:hypothetical protein n=1 Tax=Microbulbifer sp. SAOS-129_SWC TaxID=3145235 RepID=UPI00321676B5
MKNLFFLAILMTLSFSATSSEIGNIVAMSKMAKAEILKRKKTIRNDDLVLVSVSLNDRDKEFSKNLLLFEFLDKGNHKSSDISEYVYTTYWVSFSLVSGQIVRIGPSTYNTYEPITADKYYQ